MKQIKRWQEPIYAIGGFGPGFMYQIVLTYLLYFYRPALQSIAGGAVVFAPAAGYAAGILVARILDGIVDIPIAAWTDNMRSRWGPPQTVDGDWVDPRCGRLYTALVSPITGNSLGENGHWGNALYVALMSSVFFFFYTLIVVPYLASLSEIVPDETSRVRVASWQTFFNTAGYVLTFVVAPMLFDRFGVRGAIWLLLPSFLSFIGPILVIKEEPTNQAETAEKKKAKQASAGDISLLESVRLTLRNPVFKTYMISVAVFYFGLQLFLGGIAFMAVDMMGLSESQLGMMNASVFAPVPLMLILFNFISKRKGAKWGFRLGLLIFAAVMLLYPLAWTRLNFPVSPMLLGIILGGVASFSTAVFFTIPYAFPAQIAAAEAAETGKDRAGMYFAVQGLVNQFMGSLAGSFLAILLTWKFGVVAIGPCAALTMIAAYFLFSPYPLGKPSGKKSE